MSKCGIICEYNPFHNGHKYHLEKTKALTDAQIICVMSGDFTQRVRPAIFDKLLRTKAALACGADAVVELPALYATAPAERFAYGAIKILSNIRGIEYLSFGVETENTGLLEDIATLQAHESSEMKNDFLNLSKTGLSYPNCLAKATANELCKKGQNKSEILDILSFPNNILAIEYLKAIKKQNLNIKPIYIKRTDSGYNSPKLQPPYAAAGAIRQLIANEQDYSPFVPFDFGRSAIDNKIFEALMRDALLKNEINYDEGLGIKLKKAAKNLYLLQDIIDCVKTKRYTFSRIIRLIFSTMLDIDKLLFDYSGNFFFKLLGIKKSFKPSLKDLGSNAIIRQGDKNTGSITAELILNIDKRASDIYSVISSQPATRFYHKLTIV